jgi:hypothetical protein
MSDRMTHAEAEAFLKSLTPAQLRQARLNSIASGAPFLDHASIARMFPVEAQPAAEVAAEAREVAERLVPRAERRGFGTGILTMATLAAAGLMAHDQGLRCEIVHNPPWPWAPGGGSPPIPMCRWTQVPPRNNTTYRHNPRGPFAKNSNTGAKKGSKPNNTQRAKKHATPSPSVRPKPSPSQRPAPTPVPQPPRNEAPPPKKATAFSDPSCISRLMGAGLLLGSAAAGRTLAGKQKWKKWRVNHHPDRFPGEVSKAKANELYPIMDLCYNEALQMGIFKMSGN